MNRIKSKDHRIGTYEINKISFRSVPITKFVFKTMDMMD